MGKQPFAAQSRERAPRRPPQDEPEIDLALTAAAVAGLLDATPDGLLMIDARGRMLLVNRRIEELFGYTRDELLGEPGEMLLPEAVREAHVAHREDFVTDARIRQMGLGLGLQGRRRDGTEFAVDVSLSPVTRGNGRWVLAAVRDDGARQASERERRDAAVSAEQGRIAEDVADSVIRGLFGTGLSLQALLERPEQELRAGVESAIESIDRTIRDVRSAIFDLQRDRWVVPLRRRPTD